LRKVDVIWFIEHVARELDVACAVRWLAEQRYNLSIEILPYLGEADRVLREYSPYIVVIPYCYSACDPGLRNYLPQWRAPIYFNLAWEELFYKAYLGYKAPRDTFAQKNVIHHAWGNFYREYLLNHGVPEQHIFVNGHPAYKLYDQPYRNVFLTRADLAERCGLDMDRKWVFFPENYIWFFYAEARLQRIIHDGLDQDTVYLLRDFCRESLTNVLTWIAEVASDGSIEFILRPRPATRQLDFEQAVRQVIKQLPAHLHITKESSVREWILASDVVLSSFSTSLIEAAIAECPAYMVEPISLPEPLDADWHNYTTRIKTREEFLAACLGERNLSSCAALRTWARAELMGHGDPISNLADFLYRLCQPGLMRPPVPAKKIAKNSDNSPTDQRDSDLMTQTYRQLRKSVHSLLHPTRPSRDSRQDRFDSGEVARRVASVRKVLKNLKT